MIKVKGEIELINVPLSCVKQEMIDTPTDTYCKVTIKEEKSNLNFSFYSNNWIKLPKNSKFDRCYFRIIPAGYSKDGQIIFKIDDRKFDIWWPTIERLHDKPIAFILNERDRIKLIKDQQLKEEHEREEKEQKEKEYRAKYNQYLNNEWIPMVIKFINEKKPNYKDWLVVNWMRFLSINNLLKTSNKIKYRIHFSGEVLKLILDKLNNSN